MSEPFILKVKKGYLSSLLSNATEMSGSGKTRRRKQKKRKHIYSRPHGGAIIPDTEPVTADTIVLPPGPTVTDPVEPTPDNLTTQPLAELQNEAPPTGIPVVPTKPMLANNVNLPSLNRQQFCYTQPGSQSSYLRSVPPPFSM